ncbi:hypothetical protein [Pimelobacter simplex]|uniref:hypothetical protein n=1 Tax=Nocardioides simplex TaxID=2045 RepID=UPI003AAD1785
MSSPEPAGSNPRAQLIWVIGLISIAAIMILAIVGWCWSGAHRDELAQWLMAAGTGATLIAAVAAAVFAADVHRIELEREERFEVADMRAQADNVAAWGLATPRRPTTTGQTIFTWELSVRNASPLPVYDVRYLARTILTIDGVTSVQHHAPLFSHVLPPGPEAVPLTTLSMEIPTRDARFGRKLQIQYAFRDTGGRWWRRDEAGVLHGPEPEIIELEPVDEPAQD